MNENEQIINECRKFVVILSESIKIVPEANSQSLIY